ncbi:MAG: hypothetical protein H0Z38_00410 [Firmicutes bacterium]|nr:hypothetical protein [Bacillota bacterium]
MKICIIPLTIFLCISMVGCIDHDYLLVAKKEYEIKYGLASPEIQKTEEAQKEPPKQHLPYLNRECTSCHTGAGSTKLVAKVMDLCLRCHGSAQDWLEFTCPHPPVLMGDCLGCHDAHESRYPYHLTKAERLLCLDCHRVELGPEIDKTSLIEHAPVKEGKCTTCHNPHGSDFHHLLYKDAEELCQDCHNSTSRGSQALSLKCQPGCLKCHTPHASSYQGRLRAEPPGGLSS